jgi:hypothetical protein
MSRQTHRKWLGPDKEGQPWGQLMRSGRTGIKMPKPIEFIATVISTKTSAFFSLKDVDIQEA